MNHRNIVILCILIKLLYIFVFYTFLIGRFNIGDTLSYQRAVFLERRDFGSPAFVMSYISDVLSGRIWLFDIAFAVCSGFIVFKSSKNLSTRNLTLLFLAFVSPLSLIYCTVFSKELFVLAGLASIFYSGPLKIFVWTLGGLLVFWMKPAFFLLFLFSLGCLTSRWFVKNLKFVCAAIPMCALAASPWIAGVILDFYDSTYDHFYYGAMSYDTIPINTAGVISAVLIRTMLLDFSIYSSGFFLLFISFHGLLWGIVAYVVRYCHVLKHVPLTLVAVGLFAASPYGLFNAGSYARYVSPILVFLSFFSVYWISFSRNTYRSRSSNHSIYSNGRRRM